MSDVIAAASQNFGAKADARHIRNDNWKTPTVRPQKSTEPAPPFYAGKIAIVNQNSDPVQPVKAEPVLEAIRE